MTGLSVEKESGKMCAQGEIGVTGVTEFMAGDIFEEYSLYFRSK